MAKFPCPNPACGTSNFSFDTVKLTGQCFSCGFTGAGKKLLAKLKATQDVYTPRLKVVNHTGLIRPVKEGLEYLAYRGIKGTAIDSIGIKWDGESLYLPIHSPITHQKSWVRRKITGKGYYSDATPGVPFILGNPVIKDRSKCVLVEGPFSLLTPGLWGTGFSLLGSNLDIVLEKWLKTQQFGKIVLWFDPDETGFKKANEIEARLKSWHPNVVRVHGWCFDFRDPGEYDNIEAVSMMFEAERLGVWCPPKPPSHRRLL